MARVAISIFTRLPPYSAWKWGGGWSPKYIRIMMPKKRLISGMLDYTSQGWKQFFRRLSRNLEVECIRTKINLIRPLNSSAFAQPNLCERVVCVPRFEDALA